MKHTDKNPEDCSEKELLIRIDERTKDLPVVLQKLQDKSGRHDIILAVMGVVLLFVCVKVGYGFVADAVAMVLGG